MCLKLAADYVGRSPAGGVRVTEKQPLVWTTKSLPGHYLVLRASVLHRRWLSTIFLDARLGRFICPHDFGRLGIRELRQYCFFKL